MKNKFLFFVLLLFAVNYLAAQPGDSLKPTPAADKKIAAAIFQSDSIDISVHVRGCFTGYTTTVCIVKSGSIIQLDYRKYAAAGNLHMVISKKQLHRIHRLFNKGIDLPRNRAMCTTKSTFKATAHGKTVQFVDGRCSDTDDLAEQLDKLLNIPEEE